MSKSLRQLRADALAIYHAGLEAAGVDKAIHRIKLAGSRLELPGATHRHVSLDDFDRIFVVGAGKAGASMAVALERKLGARRIDGGLLNVKHDHARPRPKRIELNECAHPVPDVSGEQGARRITDLLCSLNARDLVFVLISGGASALLPAPAPPVSLRDKQKTTDLLLKCGADIFELNAVRKHLSRLKGGQLAALAYPATVVALILSDVVGDRLDVIGSGPTVADSSTFGDALRVLTRYGLTKKVPRSVMARLEDGAVGRIPETPKPGDKLLRNVHNIVIGSNRLALEAAARQAKSLGYRPLILTSSLQGEAREVARVHCEILREVLEHHDPSPPPACLLSGGETTVTVRGKGKGGRNQEFALAAALCLEGLAGAVALSCGTDGTDGPTDAAGAIADGTTVSRAAKKKISLEDHLAANDSYPVFDELGDLIITGSTGTNVMDLHILLASGS